MNMSFLKQFRRLGGVASLVFFLAIPGDAYSVQKGFLARAREKARVAALYTGVGAAGLLAAPVVYDFAKRYHKPILNSLKTHSLDLMSWSKEHPKKAIWSSLILSGVMYFGLPYVGMVSDLAVERVVAPGVALSIAKGKALTVWDQTYREGYVARLQEQKAFAEKVWNELYQIYLRMPPSEQTRLAQYVGKIQRKMNIPAQLKAVGNASGKLNESVVYGTDETVTGGSLEHFAKAAGVAEQGFLNKLVNGYRIPLWMEGFQEPDPKDPSQLISLAPEKAFIAFVGDAVIGDLRELFGACTTADKGNLSNSWIQQLNNILIANRSNSSKADAVKTTRATDLFVTLLAKTKQFIINRKHRINALEWVTFKPAKK
ncbi:MAG: hypothetical protein UV79_C0003G0032 [candidate division TM6 bacterium GW2011_GWF2_43_17]|nr:MAG: hypothetical protein UV79_C0003G0032 [candidate division TM6 bacterium GW2011_GWF2_43_17]HAU30431.1 hypothetical protein [Candidatus Dependentiae bacterium]